MRERNEPRAKEPATGRQEARKTPFLAVGWPVWQLNLPGRERSCRKPLSRNRAPRLLAPAELAQLQGEQPLRAPYGDQ